MMNHFTKKDRMEQFSKVMNPYVPEDFRKWLIDEGFFDAPASIRHHGKYSGALYDHSLVVMQSLLSLTRRIELEWEHEEKSVIMLQRFMPLTDEEIMCIRWHMGAFDIKENWNCYGSACAKYPNVLYTHTADMIATRILGV